MPHLDPILEATRRRLGSLRRRVLTDLESEARDQDPPRDFLSAVRHEGISLVAEIKRRSPSAGDLKVTAKAGELATAYKKGGARALSVLTEPSFFSGTTEDLKEARRASGLPVLRKDFVIHPFQVLESRAEGADAVLLIVTAIDDPVLLTEMANVAANLGMAAIVEVHDESELETALELKPQLIGINQRNLRSLKVERGLALQLRPRIPQDVAVIAESGISSREDVAELEAAGVDAVLVGEYLMRSDDPESAAARLLSD